MATCLSRINCHSRCSLQGLRLLLKLLVLPGSDDLDPDFCIPGPNNALYPLWRHFSHTANAGIIPLIQYELAGEGSTCRRLFKLLTPALFHKDVYHTWRRIARGASAEVSAIMKNDEKGSMRLYSGCCCTSG